MANNQSQITLKDFLDIIHEAKGVDYMNYFDTMFKNSRRSPDSLLVDYLELIDNDPVNWIETFPSALKSSTALSKPKTAMKWALESCTQIISEYGDAKSKALTDKIVKAWKDNSKRICKYRSNMDAERQEVASDLGSDGDHVVLPSQIDQINPSGSINAVPSGYIHERELMNAQFATRKLEKELADATETINQLQQAVADKEAVITNRNKGIAAIKQAFIKLAKLHYQDDHTVDIYLNLVDAIDA